MQLLSLFLGVFLVLHTTVVRAEGSTAQDVKVPNSLSPESPAKPSSGNPRGNLQAKVTLTVYCNIQATSCAVTSLMLDKPLFEKYKSSVRFEMKHFPVGLYKFSFKLGEAAECAADQGKFWSFLDIAYLHVWSMFEKEKTVKSADITSWAKELGLDMQKYSRCMFTHAKKGILITDRTEGLKRGVKTVPTYFVNGVLVPHDKLNLEDFSSLIEATLNSKIR